MPYFCSYSQLDDDDSEESFNMEQQIDGVVKVEEHEMQSIHVQLQELVADGQMAAIPTVPVSLNRNDGTQSQVQS